MCPGNKTIQCAMGMGLANVLVPFTGMGLAHSHVPLGQLGLANVPWEWD